MELSYEDAVDFFSTLYYGEHHLPSKIKPFGPAWSINHHGDCSTFDHDFLTRLVFLAHDKCYRASIMQGSPRAVKIVIWKRAKREGSIIERHPTIETALKTWRKKEAL